MDQLAVLVVEDEPVLLRVFARSLRSTEYDLVTVATLAEARKASQQLGNRLRILVTDQNVSDGKGTDLAHELCERHEGLEVIILSGDTTTVEGFETLQKPFDNDKLKQLVLHKISV